MHLPDTSTFTISLVLSVILECVRVLADVFLIEPDHADLDLSCMPLSNLETRGISEMFPPHFSGPSLCL